LYGVSKNPKEQEIFFSWMEEQVVVSVARRRRTSFLIIKATLLELQIKVSSDL